jgi:hypothetical protein
MQIQAYFENWALAPGDKVQMAISSSLGRLDAKFQRLLSISLGSICYAGSLAWNNFDNNLSAITTRVLKSFAQICLSKRVQRKMPLYPLLTHLISPLPF